jgi:hypothetical protein
LGGFKAASSFTRLAFWCYHSKNLSPWRETAVSALHEAAALLIGQASEATARAVLRLLLDDSAESAQELRSEAPRSEAQPKQARQRRQPRQSKSVNGAAIDPVWDQLRSEIRAAMKARNTTYETLAQVIGCSPLSAKINVSRRKPPSPRLLQGLREWLAQQMTAPEVAAARPTFPSAVHFVASQLTPGGQQHPVSRLTDVGQHAGHAKAA